MDDFLSRLDEELGARNEKWSHQDVHGEIEYLRERLNEELFVNTTVNSTVLGLYIITYDVTDMAGNEATQIVRFVIVQDDSELYQNSVQQVWDGTPGTFTGGILPHQIGDANTTGTVRHCLCLVCLHCLSRLRHCLCLVCLLCLRGGQ